MEKVNIAAIATDFDEFVEEEIHHKLFPYEVASNKNLN